MMKDHNGTLKLLHFLNFCRFIIRLQIQQLREGRTM